jgi:hypothetical protein
MSLLRALKKVAFKSIVTVSFVIFLYGCSTTHYEYTAPTTEQGKLCSTNCAAQREVCIGREMNRAQSERLSCEQRSEYQYRDCIYRAGNKDDEKNCFRPACYSSTNTWSCDEGFRLCFVNCGGIVTLKNNE